ncbi:D-alanyl-D-alanine carboxypeptidase family protein [Geomicrobium sp. JCM 19055]|uniref:D-alanyl-D-alanine carboxypeptidase family protein n=1 Tax=Geomicrobium sp. JCM 19055 TaxID=1460649 RepID=UPI00045ED242|nr:D-alanyl-D-alanine carboxypeptidase family protein [Geomicrobium sp. JCM 19055]GAJ99912.1 D-alanyl-D-alanine carboxypeptidase [Geomicrobium sp. JCM 19055]
MIRRLTIALSLLLCVSLFMSNDVTATSKGLGNKYVSAYEKSTISKIPTTELDEVQAEAAIVVDVNTGQLLWQKNAREPLAPASMSKIMTMYLVLEAIEDGEVNRDDVVTISEEAAETGGSTMFLQEGAEWTVKDLFVSMALASANDASVALAEHLASDEKSFVKKMNEKAVEFGLSSHANFVNSHGLPQPKTREESTLTAYDTALIGYHLIQDYPEVIELTEKPQFTLSFSNQQFYNTNQLLDRQVEIEQLNDSLQQLEDEEERQELEDQLLLMDEGLQGMDGLKTGYTNRAGYSFIGTAERGGQRLLSVVMKTDSNRSRFQATETLLEAGLIIILQIESLRATEIVPIIQDKSRIHVHDMDSAL